MKRPLRTLGMTALVIAGSLLAAGPTAAATREPAGAPRAVEAVCFTCFATLTVALSGDGGGVVTSDDHAIDCQLDGGAMTGACQNMYPIPSGPITVSLTVYPDANSQYCNRVLLPRACDLPGVAYAEDVSFGTNTTVSLTIVHDLRSVDVGIGGPGQGSVSSDEAGLSCPSVCQGLVPYGTQMTLTASPKAGSAFASWNGACATQGPVCVVVARAVIDTTAFFNIASPASPTPAPTDPPRPTATALVTVRATESTGSPSTRVTSTGLPSPAPSLATAPSPTPTGSNEPVPTVDGGGSDVLILALALVVAAGLLAIGLFLGLRRGNRHMGGS